MYVYYSFGFFFIIVIVILLVVALLFPNIGHATLIDLPHFKMVYILKHLECGILTHK